MKYRKDKKLIIIGFICILIKYNYSYGIFVEFYIFFGEDGCLF